MTRAISMPLLAALAAIALAAIGCGDGDGSSAPGNPIDGSGSDGAEQPAEAGERGRGVKTSMLGKAQFVKRAQAICREEREDILERVSAYLNENEDSDKPPPVLYADMFREVMVPNVESEIAKVRALGAPAGDEARLAAIFSGQEEALEEVVALRRVSSVDDFEGPFAEVDEKIRAYGFADCTNTPDPALEG